MLFLFGIRTVRTGYFLDRGHICYPCKAYEREIRVWRSYFHVCYLPVFPVGSNQVEIRCKNCGDETRSEIILRKYEKLVKTPLWLYSAFFIAIGLAACWFYWYKNIQKHNREYIGNPLIGDVYTIREESNMSSNYYFLRIAGIEKDSVKALQSSLEYSGFVSNLAGDDYFVKNDTLSFGKDELRQMLEKDVIYSMYRNLGDQGDFNRTK
jgi:hypothetical protein